MSRIVLIALLTVPVFGTHRVTHPWENADGVGFSPFKGGAYTGPFLKLTDNYLNVSNPADKFGAEDKLAFCNKKLVFIDLDIAGGEYFSYDGTNWSQGNIPAVTCSDGSPPLYPRDSGYTVGTTAHPNIVGQDRLIIIGGDVNDTNVYYSDDCGLSWTCSIIAEAWVSRNYATLVHTAGVFSQDMLIMSGGRAYARGYSRDMFGSIDGGLTWSRPQCTDVNNCCKYDYFGCPMYQPDAFGTCSNTTGNNWEACYTLPDWPVYPGSLATDWDSLWLWMDSSDDGYVYRLNQSTYATGWEMTTADWGGFGRKVFIKGTVTGSGCWFSTDFLVEELWLPDATATSMNNFMTSPSGYGPWQDWTGILTLPWAARASAAVTSTHSSSSAWVASGMTFNGGVPSWPVFGDAWQIDAGVCLLSPVNGQVCAGATFGTPNLDSVTCTCNAQYLGDAYCGSCTSGLTYGGYPTCTLCPLYSVDNSACGISSGRGVCDPVQGCLCGIPFANPATGCDSCAPGYWGALCGVCPICGSHGVCSGSGTSGGTGTCVCSGGWSGNDCSVPPSNSPAPVPTPSRTPVAPAAAPANPTVTPASSEAGAIAAGVMGGLIGLVLIGTFVYVKFLGGGPAVASVLTKAAKMASSAGASGSEKASLVRNSGAGITESAAKARFGGVGSGTASYSGIGSS